MLRALRSEVFRMRRRWMPWIVLGIIAVLGVVLYELVYFSVNAQLQLLRSGNAPSSVTGPGGVAAMTAQLEETLQQLRPSRVAELGVSFVAGIGSVLLIVFSASHMGTEFGWGTLRTLIASGESRAAFLATKLGSIAIFVLAFTALGVISVVAGSFVVSTQAGLDLGGLDATSIVGAAAKAAYCFLPYLALAALIALWARSSGAGIAAGLVIYFAESIVVQLLISFNSDYATIANFGLSRNVQTLSSTGVRVSAGPSSAASGLPDPTQAALVLAAWTVLFVALAFWRLRDRDITLA